MRATRISCSLAARFAYPVRVHPRGIAFAIDAYAHAAAVDRRQERGYIVQRALFLKLGDHALAQITGVFAHAQNGVNDLLRANESGGRIRVLRFVKDVQL